MSTAAVERKTIRLHHPGSARPPGLEPFHTRMVAGLGAAWILDGLHITISSSVTGVRSKPVVPRHDLDPRSGLIASMYLVGRRRRPATSARRPDRLGRKRLSIITLLLYLLGTGARRVQTGHHGGWAWRACSTRPGSSRVWESADSTRRSTQRSTR